jgi:hypothetical protein
MQIERSLTGGDLEKSKRVKFKLGKKNKRRFSKSTRKRGRCVQRQLLCSRSLPCSHRPSCTTPNLIHSSNSHKKKTKITNIFKNQQVTWKLFKEFLKLN